MDLSTQNLRLPLRNPVIAGASPLSRDVSMVRRRGIVDPTAFERASYVRGLETCL